MPHGYRLPLQTAVLMVFCVGCGTGVNIWKAIEKEDIAAIQRYAKKGGDLDIGANSYRTTPLLYAMKHKKKKSYQALLEAGAAPNTICWGGADVMNSASRDEETFWLEEAIKAGGNVELVNEGATPQKRTFPLQSAISAGQLDNVKILCAAGADIDRADFADGSPIVMAALTWRFDIVLNLLQQKANYRKPDHKWVTFIDVIQRRMQRPKGLSDNEHKQFMEVVDWLKADGFDPEKAVWDGTNWKQPGE